MGKDRTKRQTEKTALDKWDNEPPRISDCYRLKIKVEVIHDEEIMKRISQVKSLMILQHLLRFRYGLKEECRAGEKIKSLPKG